MSNPPQRFLEEANVVPDYSDLAPAVAGTEGAAATVAVAAEKPDAPSPVWGPRQATRAAAKELWRRTPWRARRRDRHLLAQGLVRRLSGDKPRHRELLIVAPNSFAKEYIESRFGDLLSRALAELCGDGCALAVAVGRSEKADGQDRCGGGANGPGAARRTDPGLPRFRGAG